MRWIRTFFQLAVLLFLVLWLTAEPGTARLVWHGYVIETSAALLTLGLVAAALFLSLLHRLWRLIIDGPRFWRLRQKIGRMEKGQGVLTQGLAALAAGDGVEAGRCAVSARKSLGSIPLIRFLQAEAAKMAGDRKVARELYTSLTVDGESAALGYRGLILAALKEGDWAEAERLLEKWRHQKPQAPWLHLVRFEIATRQQKWEEAIQALGAARKAKLLTAPVANRRQAALLLGEALSLEGDGASGLLLEKAEQAWRLMPDWLPAILILASAQAKAGHTRAALRLIEKSWAAAPHPDLAALYAGLGHKESDRLAGYKQVESLTRNALDAAASRLALAEAALAADLWGAARQHLLVLASRRDATQGVFRLLAKLERHETGDEKAVAAWLSRLGEALPDPRWICGSCGGSHPTWQATCLHCGAFDRLAWQIPGSVRPQAEPAPLLLGE